MRKFQVFIAMGIFYRETLKLTRARNISLGKQHIELLLLIRSLERGGAERQLLELARGLDKKQFSVTIAYFYDGGSLQPLFESIADLQLVSLHKKGRWDIVSFLWRWWKVLVEKKPHIVHGYMGIANELSLLGKLLGAKVVWGLRASFIDIALESDWLVRWSFLAAAKLSFLADKIIANSRAGEFYYTKKGYCRKHIQVIANGIDSDYFSPAQTAGKEMRICWHIENKWVIGLTARLDPLKDHATFLKAASLLSKQCDNIQFVCVGDGRANYRKELQDLAHSLGLGDKVLWAGICHDMCAVYNAFDIATCCSCGGEGFPNAIAEAMACGIPCVVTDIGDTRWIVNDTGKVVASKDPLALANAWREIIDMSEHQRELLGKKARFRIVENFSRQRLVNESESIFQELCHE